MPKLSQKSALWKRKEQVPKIIKITGDEKYNMILGEMSIAKQNNPVAVE